MSTTSYLAPEVIDLKQEDEGKERERQRGMNQPQLIRSPPPYNKSVDIQGLGLVGYTLFLVAHVTGAELTQQQTA